MPWLGYLHRMAQADSVRRPRPRAVQRRGNYQNHHDPDERRAALAHRAGGALRQKELIVESRSTRRWRTRHAGGRCAFPDDPPGLSRSPLHAQYAPGLRRIFETRWTRVVDLSAAMLEFLRDAYGIRTKIVRSSELSPRGAKSELILNLCREVGADTLLVGLGGSRDYLDKAEFERHGIALAYQQFTHPVYAQCGTAPFSKGLSSLDMLLNCGADSRRLLLGEAKQEADVAA
jgi:hypothetical protein